MGTKRTIFIQITAQPLEPADIDLALAAQALFHPFIPLPFIEAIDTLGALCQAIERRAGQIQMALINQRAHLGEEEGHQKRSDMGAVDISVGHDDDLVIAQIVDVEPRAQPDAKRIAEVLDFCIGGDLGRPNDSVNN